MATAVLSAVCKRYLGCGNMQWLDRITYSCLDRFSAYHLKLMQRRKLQMCVTAENVRFLKDSRVINQHTPDSIRIGKNSVINAELLTFRHGGLIEIGENCFVSQGSRIWSAEHVKLGDRVIISHNVNILDSDCHSLSATYRADHFSEVFLGNGELEVLPNVKWAPITIEDDVWIGFNVSIMKGVRIGCGAVIGAGSFVISDVEPYTITAGNPAKSIASSLP